MKRVLARVGSNLHKLRRTSGRTQAELAEELGITDEHLRGVEGGYRAPSLRLLVSAAQLFEVDVAVFFRAARQLARNPGRPRRS